MLTLLTSAILATGFTPQQSLAETAVWDGSLSRTMKGAGTVDDPFLISTAEEMAYLIQNYDNNSGIYYKKHFKLTADLDMRTARWTFACAASDHKSFHAYFDGAGHKISNLEIILEDSSKELHVGLFPQLGGDKDFESVIENLEVSNIHFIRSKHSAATNAYNMRIGGLVGQQYANSRISNCIVRNMEFVDYADNVTLSNSSRLVINPIVGEVQPRFGSNTPNAHVRTATIESCYGTASALDLSHFHGNIGQIVANSVQGITPADGYNYNNYYWNHLEDDQFSFYSADVNIVPATGGVQFQYEAFLAKEKGHTYTYKWSLDGKELSTSSAEITILPAPVQQRLSVTVHDNGHLAGSAAILIEPDPFTLQIEKVQEVGISKHVTVNISRQSGQPVDNSEFNFSWQDVDNNYQEVGTTATLTNAQDQHTYLLVASHKTYQNAKFSIFYSTYQPIYVCNRGISKFDADVYTTSGKYYEVGKDTNDGLTPESAVKTLKRAYELLKTKQQGGSLGSNLIVIMGEYEEQDFSEYLDNLCSIPNPNYFEKDKPAILTGRYNDIRNGRLLIAGESVQLMADTRFEQITLHGATSDGESPSDLAKIFANGYNLTMGYGIVINGYKNVDSSMGMPSCSFAPSITLYGGKLNNNDPNYTSPSNTLTIHSGNYGRIIAGSAFHKVMNGTSNITGSPSKPTHTTIICDIANYSDPFHNQLDVATIVGGQADGSIYANNVIHIKGNSRIGSIIGGNLGFGRQIADKPSDSFFGKTSILVEKGFINEIYGTNMGRYSNTDAASAADSCLTYFYGCTHIDIKGGVIRNNIFGGGAAAIVGAGYDDAHYSLDPFMPYRNGSKLAYSNYTKAKGKLPQVVCGNETIDLSTSEIHIKIEGDALVLGSIYAGSQSYSEHLPTRYAGCQVGNIFGSTYLDMTGGRVEGYIFGGSHGNLSYYYNSDNSGYPTVNGKNVDGSYFTRIGQLYGDSHISITGGELVGILYGGGEGTYYHSAPETNTTNVTEFLGSVYGNTHVYVGGNAIIGNYIFGGCNYADVLRTGNEEDPKKAGNIHVTISGGTFYNGIFGGGHGYVNMDDHSQSIYSEVAGDTHVTVTGGKFAFKGGNDRYTQSNSRFYGICAGGLGASVIRGNTWVEVSNNLFSDQLFQEAGEGQEDNFVISTGNFGVYSTIEGNVQLVIDGTKQPLKYRDLYGGTLNGVVKGNTNLTLKGNVYVENLYGGSRQGEIEGNCHITLLGGHIANVFGGSKKGNIAGETFVNIGSENDASGTNSQIAIGNVYGGNDITGVVGNNAIDKGTHINIHGGKIDNVYGAGKGLRLDPADKRDKAYIKVESLTRPHVAATWINIQGTPSSPATITNSVYGGGDNTTVGIFDRAQNDRTHFGMIREDLRPNTGSIWVNIGSHVRIENLIMGSNGAQLLDYIPYYTLDGKTWTKGFENQKDFETFCHSIDVSCIPTLTFNKDGKFHNDYCIDDRINDKVDFLTPGEMDAEDVVIGNFFGGANRGSMTSDSLLQYTLPTGLVIENQIVGGCNNSIIEYTETEGPNQGTTRKLVGGMKPYRHVEAAIHDQRTQLNVFCQFAKMQAGKDVAGEVWHKGAKIYGGCLESGVSVGVSVVNLHTDLLGGFRGTDNISMSDLANEWTSDGGEIYGGGKGVATEAIGNTYVNLKGGVFNGIKCVPNVLHAFAGGMQGNVVGRSNIYCDFQSPIATPMDAVNNCIWGSLYGGGREGDVVRHSKLLPEVEEPHENGTHVRVWSGQIDKVFGGSRIGNVEGASFVDIDDRGENHFHTIIRSVYGGNDLSGTIGANQLPAMIEGNKPFRASTYVLIREHKKSDGQYLGFPLITEVFGGSNGNYGTHDENKAVYASGTIPTREGSVIDLKGMALPVVDSTYVEVRGGTVWYLYAGCNNSFTTKMSVIKVDYNDENVNARASFDKNTSEECYKRGKLMNELLKNDGGNLVTDEHVTALYNVFCIFGGNNKTPLIIQPTWQLGQAKIHNLYGGCNKGDVWYYANEQNLNDKSVNLGLQLELNSQKLDIDNVYGGCRIGNVEAHNMWVNADNTYHKEPVTLSGNEYGTTIHITEGTYGRVFGGNDISGKVYSGTRIQIDGGKINEVYGAGNGEYVYKCTDSVDKTDAIFDAELQQFVCLVPTFNKHLTDFEKISAIEEARPNTAKTYLEIAGGIDDKTGKRKVAYISGAIYAGGNCAKVIQGTNNEGKIYVDLGDYSVINKVYLGSNGQKHIEHDYISNILKYNEIVDLKQTNEKGQNILDKHMDAVIMHGLPQNFRLHNNYDHCYIGSFFLGGARGSIAAHGNLRIQFPKTLNIFDKVVGGSDQAKVTYQNGSETIVHEGGFLWDGIGKKPQILMDVDCQFHHMVMDMNEKYASQNYLRKISDDEVDALSCIYAGCYGSGKIDGEVNINLSEE